MMTPSIKSKPVRMIAAALMMVAMWAPAVRAADRVVLCEEFTATW